MKITAALINKQSWLFSPLQINTNGILSFNTPRESFTDEAQQGFPVQHDTPGELIYKIVAPFWADFDSTQDGSGIIWYRQTADEELLSQVKSDLLEHALLYPEVDIRNFNPTLMVVVTWDGVWFYGAGSDNTLVWHDWPT